MKVIVAWPLSWLLYWAGHLVSKPMHFTWPLESGWPWGHLYPLYNKLMTLSNDLQDWAGDPKHFPWAENWTEDPQ